MLTGSYKDKYAHLDDANRERDAVVIALHKDTGKLFGGKKNGTHIGYPKKQHLKAAMTERKVKHEDYIFLQLSFNERFAPEFRVLEGATHVPASLQFHLTHDGGRKREGEDIS